MSNPWPGESDMTRNSTVLRYVSGLLLTALTSGCTTWHPYTLGGPLDSELPARLRLLLRSGDETALRRPPDRGAGEMTAGRIEMLCGRVAVFPEGRR